MSRPAVKHDGFLIPNASGVAEPVLAEPDQIDFNTLANAKWGVIEGCTVNSQSNKSVAVSPGTAIVNGNLVRVNGGSINLPTPGANSQFVLVVVDAGGAIKLNTDAPSSIDPVFPDPKADETVLASVLCDATAGSFANYIVDKRKLLSTSLLTKIDPTSELVRNVNNTGNHYLVTGEGNTTWESDTRMYRSSPGTLKIEDDLIVANDLQVTADITSSTVTATGKVLGSNLQQGDVLPLAATDGDLFVHTGTGNLYVWINGAWNQFASMSATQGVVPVGTVIMSLQPATVMRGLGWFPLDGKEIILEADHPAIFNVDTGGAVTGTAPNRSMTLPDLNKRVLQVNFDAPHQNRGASDSNLLTLNVNQMPKHKHSVGGTTVPGRTSSTGAHSHSVDITAGTGAHANHTITGGSHDHPVYDPGHAHNGMDWYGVSAAIIGWVGFQGTPQDGKNKLDALFNDSSHTYTVEPIRWTMKANTGISIGTSASHGHSIAGGAHDHATTVGSVLDHFHTVTESEVGGTTPIDFTPYSFTTYAYIRA